MSFQLSRPFLLKSCLSIRFYSSLQTVLHAVRVQEVVMFTGMMSMMCELFPFAISSMTSGLNVPVLNPPHGSWRSALFAMRFPGSNILPRTTRLRQSCFQQLPLLMLVKLFLPTGLCRRC